MALLFPAFCGMVVALVLLSPGRFPSMMKPLGSFALIGCLSLAAAWFARRVPALAPPVLIVGSLALLLSIYSCLSFVAPWVLPEDREWFMLRIDRLVLGYTWERWWTRLQSATLSDFLQVCYTSFYGLPLVLGAALARRRDWEGLYGGLDRIMLGFLLSYCGYLLVPTRSPYFFVEYSDPLPTHGLQALLNSDVVELSWTRRDCFPSGHTMLSLIVAWLAWIRVRPAFWLLGPWALCTVTATLYLRYHYLVDVLAGIACFLAFVPVSTFLFGSYRPKAAPDPLSPGSPAE